MLTVLGNATNFVLRPALAAAVPDDRRPRAGPGWRCPACSAPKLDAHAGAGGRSHKAIIMIFLSGGPPHQDMFDLKPDAPAEIRGEFKPIKTNVPGIEICEHLPRLAQMMDKFAVIRSLVGCAGPARGFQCMTGYPNGPRAARRSAARSGAVVAKLQGPVDPAVPPFVGLSPKTRHAPVGEPRPAGLPRHGPRRRSSPTPTAWPNMVLRA